MFAGQDTTAKAVSFSKFLLTRSQSQPITADIRPVGARQETPCSRETSERDYGNTRKNKGQG